MKLTGRTKERYSPTPTAAERRFHLWLMDMPCACCGSMDNVVFHHLLTRNPHSRWRRDHELGFPLTDRCHQSLHSDGDEWAWAAARGFDPVARSLRLRDEARAKGVL